MKNNILIASLIIFINFIYGQDYDGDSLISLPSLTNSEMLSIDTNTVNQGALVYNSDFKKVFQYNGSEWKQLLERPPSIEVKTTDYTVTQYDNNNVINFDSVTDVSLTLPDSLPIGFSISVYQIGSGQVTIVGSGSVQIKNRLSRFKTAGEGAGVGIVQTDTSVFHITGDLTK